MDPILSDIGPSAEFVAGEFEGSPFVNEQSALVRFRVGGVRFRLDGKPEFLAVAETSREEGENWESIYRYTPGEGFLEYSADKLYPVGEPDALDLPLYYDQTGAA